MVTLVPERVMVSGPLVTTILPALKWACTWLADSALPGPDQSRDSVIDDPNRLRVGGIVLVEDAPFA